MTWDPFRGMLWVLYDQLDELWGFCADPSDSGLGPLSLAVHYTGVKGEGQEGVAFAGAAGEFLVLAEDRNSEDHQVMRYDWPHTSYCSGTTAT